MKIFTSYYANVKKIEGYKVQISVSVPTDALVDYNFGSISPDKSTLWNHKNKVINNAQYTAEYMTKLNANKEQILAEMKQIIANANLAKEDRVILLCWEGKSKFCHRHLFADWYKQQTGTEITEL
jgi:uncharacterized protein YeaO (DUF488 family)